MPQYECDQCGACCKGHLIVEADVLDVLREPKLAETDPHFKEKSHDEVLIELQDDFGKAVIIACGTDRPCPFLGRDSRCTIYPTRPNDCVGMQAGDEQCQVAREAVGLPRLQSVVESPNTPKDTTLWNIYHGDGEYAREVGDRLLGQVIASTREEAIENAMRGKWYQGGASWAPSGYTAVPNDRDSFT